MEDIKNGNKQLKSYQQYTELQHRYSQSGGSQKLWNYFVAKSKTEQFQEQVSLLKKKYQVPSIGFPRIKNAELVKKGKCSGYCYRLVKEIEKIEVCIDGYPMPPDTWEFKNTDQEIALNVDVMNICSQSGLHWVYWHDVIKFLIFYNTLHRISEGEFDLCMLSDLREEKDDPFGEAVQTATDTAYPIAIRISPYASQRDILDYIKKLYKSQIEPSLARYRDKGIKIGKVKRKKESVQQRNDFIYDNRSLPIKKIVPLVKEQFKEHLDQGHIGKIISLEKKRRKDV